MSHGRIDIGAAACLAAAAKIAEVYAGSATPKNPDAVIELLEKSYQKLIEFSEDIKAQQRGLV